MEPLQWTTLEFEEKNRHRDWNWTAGLIFVLGAIVAFFYSDLFFGIFLLLAGGLVIMFASRAPKQITISIEKDVISVDGHTIPYTQITAFWIDENQKPDKLLLRVRAGFLPMVVLHIQGVTADTVRTALLEKGLTETEMVESFSARIFERLGF